MTAALVLVTLYLLYTFPPCCFMLTQGWKTVVFYYLLVFIETAEQHKAGWPCQAGPEGWLQDVVLCWFSRGPLALFSM